MKITLISLLALSTAAPAFAAEYSVFNGEYKSKTSKCRVSFHNSYKYVDIVINDEPSPYEIFDMQKSGDKIAGSIMKQAAGSKYYELSTLDIRTSGNDIVSITASNVNTDPEWKFLSYKRKCSDLVRVGGKTSDLSEDAQPESNEPH